MSKKKREERTKEGQKERKKERKRKTDSIFGMRAHGSTHWHARTQSITNFSQINK
jgi:hypothetical protein